MTAIQERASDVPVGRRRILWEMVEKSENRLSGEEREQLFALLVEYDDLFATGPEDFGRTGKLKHEIDTGESRPIRQQVRRIPSFRREEATKLRKEMLTKDVIQPSSSPWASPVVLVGKKDDSTRFCVDYREVNNPANNTSIIIQLKSQLRRITRILATPMPLIHAI